MPTSPPLLASIVPHTGPSSPNTPMRVICRMTAYCCDKPAYMAARRELGAGWLDQDPFALVGLVAEREIRLWPVVLGPWVAQQ